MQKLAASELSSPPVEITIHPNGSVTTLDQEFLLDAPGTLTVERTSEIVYNNDPERTFSIRFVNELAREGKGPRAGWVYWWHYQTLLANPPPDYPADEWNGLLDPQVKQYGHFILKFPTYNIAVMFERWIVPTLRRVHGETEY